LKEYDICFDTVIIDEAAQSTEPACLIPLRYGCTRLVLIGDPRQLPATVKSSVAAQQGLGVSLFERLEKLGHEVVMLTRQYRMHAEIRSFPSMHFYDNLLVDDDKSVANRRLLDSSVASGDPHNLITSQVSFFDIDFSQGTLFTPQTKQKYHLSPPPHKTTFQRFLSHSLCL